MSAVKRIILLAALPLTLSAQVVNIPNTTFPTVRTLLNSNFSYLQNNKMTAPVVYSPATTYNRADVVSYGGIWYVSLQGPNAGNTPSSSPLFWGVAPTGPAGAAGAAGAAGPTGATGPTGPSGGGGGSGASWASGVFTSTSSFTITHGLNTSSPHVTLWDSAGFLLGSTYSAANVTILQATSANAVAVTLSASASGTWSVVGPPSGGGGGGISWTTSLTNSQWTTSLTNSQWTGTIAN